MSLISLPNELLLCHIFSCDAISITDLKCIMISCHHLYKIIRESNELWRHKFLTRWPHIPLKEEDKNKKLWLHWVSERFRIGKAVNETVGALSSKYYPDGKTAMSLLDNWIEQEYPTLQFVEDELRDLSFNQKKNENLTVSYYAVDMLFNLRRFTQLQKWEEFRGKSPSHHNESLYLEGTILISQWFQNSIETEHITSSSDIECSLENIVQKVKQYFLLMENAKPTFNFEAIDMGKNSRKLLNVINLVIFNELCFRIFNDEDVDEDVFDFFKGLSITKFLETKKGSSTILCIIYYEVARRIGIKCEPVYFRGRLFLKWREYHEIYYIDVCDRGSLTKSSYSHDPDQPVASVELILQRTIHKANEIYREMIRFSDPVIESSDISHFKCWLANGVRLECAVTPRVVPLIMEYAELCICDGMYLSEAIQLLQSVGFGDDNPLIVGCKNKLMAQQEEIIEAKIPNRRVPSIKYAVGLVMNYNYEDPDHDIAMRSDTCVITSWDIKLKESKEWTTVRSVSNMDQPFYRILLDEDSLGYHYSPSFGQLNVPEETLELHPTGVVIKQDELGNHFERFDGRKYVPNAEKRVHYPEDEAVAISIIGG